MKFLYRLFSILAGIFGVLIVLFITVVVFLKIREAQQRNKGFIGVIDVAGAIYSANSILEELNDLLEERGLKAIIVRVNSPGGLVAPSQEIYESLKRADQKVPVFISMGPLAASGGYYSALGGRKIYASPGTLTASIGVIMEFANTEKLFRWAKIERYTLKAGKFKDVGTPFRDMKPEERELLMQMLTNIHLQFKNAVRERRKLSAQSVDAIADGRVMTGEQAFKAGLVDELGGFEKVLADSKKLAGLPDSAHVQYPSSKSGLIRKLLLGEDNSESITQMGALLSNTLKRSSGARVLLLAPLLD
ncbi:MAG: signal peptide peptidase SppA [Deltaproteobacteria bacterium]|nr:signal peptide peptidase SppA [Deltaproteobacteria bacterium]